MFCYECMNEVKENSLVTSIHNWLIDWSLISWSIQWINGSDDWQISASPDQRIAWSVVWQTNGLMDRWIDRLMDWLVKWMIDRLNDQSTQIDKNTCVPVFLCFPVVFTLVHYQHVRWGVQNACKNIFKINVCKTHRVC